MAETKANAGEQSAPVEPKAAEPAVISIAPAPFSSAATWTTA